MPSTFHLRVRALCYADHKVLLTRWKGADHTFLPGGHVEPGEGLAAALLREIKEELGVDCNIRSYLGAIEQVYAKESAKHHEIVHVFLIDAAALKPSETPTPLEPEYEFLWSTIDDLDANNLQPAITRNLIRRWVSGDRSPWWDSAL
ncbi:MAG: NUDIX domain-containing protein [bacterium]|nr:NUDIX domain-containing protein [bacterium]